jgi:hypothetical protein
MAPSFLISVLNEREWSASRPGSFTPGIHWVGGWIGPEPVWMLWRRENLASAGNRIPVVQPVVHRCTDWAPRRRGITILIFITCNSYITRAFQFLCILCIININGYKTLGCLPLIRFPEMTFPQMPRFLPMWRVRLLGKYSNLSSLWWVLNCLTI